MEFSLHRQLKEHYATPGSRCEVRLGRYRIDVVQDTGRGDRLIEIQHGSLAAIRDKVAALVRRHEVVVVKPIVANKWLVKHSRRGGRVVGRRQSPKHARLVDVFDELVYFVRVFPHRRLTLEVPLVDVEESRYPGHGRRRYRRPQDFRVADQRLLAVGDVITFRTAAQLWDLVSPGPLPQPFHTGHLAEAIGEPRWMAQRIAYVFREIGFLVPVGKRGNARLYNFSDKRRRAA